MLDAYRKLLTELIRRDETAVAGFREELAKPPRPSILGEIAKAWHLEEDPQHWEARRHAEATAARIDQRRSLLAQLDAASAWTLEEIAVHASRLQELRGSDEGVGAPADVPDAALADLLEAAIREVDRLRAAREAAPSRGPA